jgi:hypothetical protein
MAAKKSADAKPLRVRAKFKGSAHPEAYMPPTESKVAGVGAAKGWESAAVDPARVWFTFERQGLELITHMSLEGAEKFCDALRAKCAELRARPLFEEWKHCGACSGRHGDGCTCPCVRCATLRGEDVADPARARRLRDDLRARAAQHSVGEERLRALFVSRVAPELAPLWDEPGEADQLGVCLELGAGGRR